MDTTDYVQKLVGNERDRHLRLGFDSAHDDAHTPTDWVAIVAHELGCAADRALQGPDGFNGACVKIAAVASAAASAGIRAAARPKRKTH